MRWIWVCLLVVMTTSAGWGDEVSEALSNARKLLRKGDAQAAIPFAQKAVEKDPKSLEAAMILGDSYSSLRKQREAIEQYERALKIDPTFLIAQDRRGGERFKLGQVEESLVDFDAFLKANPQETPSHWRRGISYYYVGKYPEGAKQFYDGRQVFGADVENAFWHYLCNARQSGVEKARASILKVDEDRRVPMMKIYDLIQGKCLAADVIETAEKAKLGESEKNEALFYGHLYVALNYEAEGKKAECRKHLEIAVEKHPIGHYMWDVAKVHLDRVKMK
jgi:lipoprotein NlpI